MKTIYDTLVWGFIFILVIGCSNEIESDNKTYANIDDSMVQIKLRTYQEALEIAQKSISILEGEKGITRSSVKRRSVDKNAVIISSKQNITRSTNCQGDTLLYVFNYSDNQGFAVVSASKDTEGLLAITDKGRYNTEECSGIEGFDMFMDLATVYVQYSKPGIKLRPPYDFTEIKDSIAVHESYDGPYVTVRWGQTGVEGGVCPNHTAGCAITAMAQAMSYYEYPAFIALTYDGADELIQLLNWSDIKNHISYYECNDSPTYHTAIARLCRQLGELAGTTYGSQGSSTGNAGMEYAMQSMGYQTGGWQAYNETPLISNIQQHKILLMRGSRYNETGEEIGHAWLLDGVYTRTTEVFTFSKTQFELFWNLVYYNTMTSYYYHFNWGYDGSNNGYFSGNVFNTANVVNPDTNMNYINKNYNINVMYLPIYH